MFKKGQTTIFIIIGIIILLTFLTFIYLRTAEKEKVLPPERGEIEQVPSDLMPIKSYVEDCIGKLTEEGLRILSEHGGYIYQNFDIKEPTEGNAVEVYPGSDFYVPYWYYMKSPNDCQSGCIFTSDIMPQLCKPGRSCITAGMNSIEKQLDNYIKNELKKCVKFEEFREQGIVITGDKVEDVNTMVRDKDVLVTVNYPLTITKLDKTSKISDFRKATDSDIAEMYEIAYDIVSYEAENCFIGDHTRNYYSYFMGLDSNKLPPIYDLTIGSSKVVNWNLYNVKQDLKSKTANAMMMLGIFNTSGFRWPLATKTDHLDTRQGIYDQFVFYPLRRYHDAAVTMHYFPWLDPYLDIKPSEGGLLVPTDLGGGGGLASIVSSITQTKIYEFFYQYSFPVIVEIRKKDKLGKEYLFRFAIESNIRANKCFNANASLVHPVSMGTMICDIDQRTENLTVTVKDKQNQPLADVSVSFFAGQSCPLGVTGTDGKLDVSYPNAFGGFLKFSKDSYVDKWVNQKDFEKNMAVNLEEFTYLTATVKKLVMTEPDMCCSAARNLGSKDQVIINLEKATDANDPYDQDLTQPMMFNGDDAATLTNEVKLIPGKYKIDAHYFRNDEYTIQKKCVKICSDYDWLGDCDDWDYLPEEPQKSKPIGGAVFDEETGYWEITEQELRGKSNVEFYVIVVPDANCIMGEEEISSDDMECLVPGGCIGLDEMGKVGNYSKTFRNSIKPKLS